MVIVTKNRDERVTIAKKLLQLLDVTKGANEKSIVFVSHYDSDDVT